MGPCWLNVPVALWKLGSQNVVLLVFRSSSTNLLPPVTGGLSSYTSCYTSYYTQHCHWWRWNCCILFLPQYRYLTTFCKCFFLETGDQTGHMFCVLECRREERVRSQGGRQEIIRETPAQSFHIHNAPIQCYIHQQGLPSPTTFVSLFPPAAPTDWGDQDARL